MNFYDLEKQATPGPLEILNCSGGDAIRLKEGCVVFDRGSPDAKAFLHCRNNYTRALQLLKAEHQTVIDTEAHEYGITHNPRTCKICQDIKDLETVK